MIETTRMFALINVTTVLKQQLAHSESAESVTY